MKPINPKQSDSRIRWPIGLLISLILFGVLLIILPAILLILKPQGILPQNQNVVAEPISAVLPPASNPSQPFVSPRCGIGESGLRAGATIHRRSQYPSSEAALKALKPGDSLLFDVAETQPIKIVEPLRDVQFIGGQAKWEIGADLEECQFFFHEVQGWQQISGMLQKIVWCHCPISGKVYCQRVNEFTIYFPPNVTTGSLLPAEELNDATLDFRGFIRGLSLVRPIIGRRNGEQLDSGRKGIAIRIEGTEAGGQGEGSAILGPIIMPYRFTKPIQIVVAKDFLISQPVIVEPSWAGPAIEVLSGEGVTLLEMEVIPKQPVDKAMFANPPTKITAPDGSITWGHQVVPFRGAAAILSGVGNRLLLHGTSNKIWSVGSASVLPGFHPVDGVVACDPAFSELFTFQGGVTNNLAKDQASIRVSLSGKQLILGSHFGSRELTEIDPNLAKISDVVLLPLQDLRIQPFLLNRPMVDMTGKSITQIEAALAKKQTVYLGAGIYRFNKPISEGTIIGSGMDATILEWPKAMNCLEGNCQGVMNATVRGGKIGFMMTPKGKLNSRIEQKFPSILRVCFDQQTTAGIQNHAASNFFLQDVVFRNGSMGLDLNCSPGNSGQNIDLVNLSFDGQTAAAIRIEDDLASEGRLMLLGIHANNVATCDLKAGSSLLILQSALQLAKWNLKSKSIAIGHSDIRILETKKPAQIQINGTAIIDQSRIVGIRGEFRTGLISHTQIDGHLDFADGSMILQSQVDGIDKDSIQIRQSNAWKPITVQTNSARIDTTPPPPVEGVRVRTIQKQRVIEWKPVEDPESGILEYLILSDGKMIASTPIPVDSETSFQKSSPLQYIDPNPEHRLYSVIAVNGAGLQSNGQVRKPGAWTFETRWLDQQGIPVLFNGFIRGPTKNVLVQDSKGNRLPVSQIGLRGFPTESFWQRSLEVMRK
jgi:hypothetical protein